MRDHSSENRYAPKPRSREHRDVVGVAPEVVARVAGRLVVPRAGGVLELPPVVVPVAALDLVRGGRGAPEEPVGKEMRHGRGTLDSRRAMGVLDEILARSGTRSRCCTGRETADLLRKTALDGAADPRLRRRAAARRRHARGDRRDQAPVAVEGRARPRPRRRRSRPRPTSAGGAARGRVLTDRAVLRRDGRRPAGRSGRGASSRCCARTSRSTRSRCTRPARSAPTRSC